MSTYYFSTCNLYFYIFIDRQTDGETDIDKYITFTEADINIDNVLYIHFKFIFFLFHKMLNYFPLIY